MKLKKQRNHLPIMYASYYPMLKEIAIKYGYALAIHGSLTKDMDLIAVVWISRPRSYKRMIEEMRKKIGGGYMNITSKGKGNKPHGRKSFLIHSGGGGYLDISVIPPC